MKSLSELIKNLEDHDPDLPGNIDTFEEILSDIVALRTADSIIPLLGFFRDNARYDELMFSIIHSIEIFDNEIYVNKILRGAISLCKKSPRWASIIFMRIINSESTRNELIRQLRGADPSVKMCIKKLMKEINVRSIQFLPKTAAVLVAAS